jgi:hypothetical protein
MPSTLPLTLTRTLQVQEGDVFNATPNPNPNPAGQGGRCLQRLVLDHGRDGLSLGRRDAAPLVSRDNVRHDRPAVAMHSEGYHGNAIVL